MEPATQKTTDNPGWVEFCNISSLEKMFIVAYHITQSNQNKDETNDVWYQSSFVKNGVLYTPLGAYTLSRGYFCSWNMLLVSSCQGEIKMKENIVYGPSTKRKKRS